MAGLYFYFPLIYSECSGHQERSHMAYNAGPQATCDGNISESIICADDLTSALGTCVYSILNSFPVDCWPLSTTLKGPSTHTHLCCTVVIATGFF